MVEEAASMAGKTCLVTGATSGIGKETARGLLRRGAHVLLVARDRARGEAALAEIGQSSADGSCELLLSDLSSRRQVRQLAADVRQRHGRLDVLVNNAGASFSRRRVTEDGLEATFATNYLGPFLLTNLLLEALRQGAPSRIVNVASDTHRWVKTIPWDDLQGEATFKPLAAYNQSKLFDVLFTYELARRLRGTGVVANCLHPGWPLKTDLDRDARGPFAFFAKVTKRFGATAEAGAQTTIHLATAPDLASVSGRYFAKCASGDSSDLSRDEAAARRLWEVSERLCHPFLDPPPG